MQPLPRPMPDALRPGLRWLIALALVALGLAARVWLWPDQFGRPYIVYYFATVAIFYVSGWLPGGVAVGLFAVAAFMRRPSRLISRTNCSMRAYQRSSPGATA